MVRHVFPSNGLYAVTREAYACIDELVRAVEAAVRGGVRVVQYRAKHARDRAGESRALVELCRSVSVPLIVNDDVELACAVGADGVHLGRDDGSVAEARERLGPDAIIGLSCYDSIERARVAEQEGADYVAFGRFFPSLTKPDAPCARLQTLIEARHELHVPIVAIGGITVENGYALIQAGAGLLAVIEGVFGQADPEQAARDFAGLWRLPGYDRHQS